MKNLVFWIRLIISVLSALLGALGASAAGLGLTGALCAGSAAGCIWEFLPDKAYAV